MELGAEPYEALVQQSFPGAHRATTGRSMVPSKRSRPVADRSACRRVDLVDRA